MANPEESSPLLNNQEEENNNVDEKAYLKTTNEKANEKLHSPPEKSVQAPVPAVPFAGEWTANGMPLGHGSVMGEPMGRAQWNSDLFACLGRNDHFCGSDLEVCLLGSVAPCVLYGSNVERIGSEPGAFSNHCLTYAGLFLIGNAIFGSNFFAPWFSYRARTAIRRKFNLEASYAVDFCDFLLTYPSCVRLFGLAVFTMVLSQTVDGSCEALSRSCGCCGSLMEDEVQREQCETACDFATHVLCHPCALCQEGREIRRRIPHPAFNTVPVLVMIPPGEQIMGRTNA
ncbi:PLAC8 motif-containing protein [Dillenia turbinata]|uniref:PLAC8 motif-containing protein n=1 Tax=Dillenia turbinata TaxID=194707 RepID=A0AAN8WA92_9MAGN